MLKIGHYIPAYRAPVRSIVRQIAAEATSMARLGYEYHVEEDAIGDIVLARNQALESAIAGDLDYLCMQDSDNFCPHPMGAIAPMLQTATENKAAMVAAIVGLRQDPVRPNVEPALPGEVYKGTRAGTGIVLIDVKQVAKYPRPWFMNIYNRAGTKKECGQDIYFSRLVEREGGELWIDGRIPTRHVQEDFESLFYPGKDATAGGKSQVEETAL